MKFFDINNMTRIYLKEIYESIILKTKPEKVFDCFLEKIKIIKNNNESLYKYLVGLMFVDDYKLITGLDEISETEEETLSFYESVNDLDELLLLIDEDESILSNMILSPVIFYNFNNISKAYMIDGLDNEIIKNFNIYSSFEKHNLFKDITMDDISQIYNSNLVETEDCYDDENSIDKVIENLIILGIGNIECFKLLVLKMIKTPYKWHKFREYENEELDLLETKFIKVIENNSLDDMLGIIYSDIDLLELIVVDYFYYINDNEYIDKDEVESLYEKIDEKIKRKLKEV